MSIRNQNWYNLQATRSYPLDESCSGLDNAAAAACEANEAHEAKEEEHVPGSSAEAQAAEAVARRLVAFEKRILSAQLQLLEADV